jgi:hypothetical protein
MSSPWSRKLLSAVVDEVPVVGQRYLRRGMHFVRAQPGMAGPRECVFVFDGENFLACGLG